MSSNDIAVTERPVPGTRVVEPDPRRNPSYPQRIHWGERDHWRGVLEHWTARVVEAKSRLDALQGSGEFEARSYLFAQMRGGLDQVADCVRRLPGEAGALYEEDRHRIEQAVEALERTFRKWDRA
ncbi:MAG: hypothetical protein SFX72_03440 [Isosphaeraceae bacterium]|nr:hypothetical protein [Isosphaeraceae bacterium]